MLLIEFRFPSGRFHATPWDSHVNEGNVEWPPSLWRIARALVATRHLRAPELPEEKLAALLEILGSESPEWWIPQTTASHTRHYLPLFKVKKSGEHETAKVFDAFVHVGDQPLLAIFRTLTLSEDDAELLELLLSRLTYFGRAESWCEARLVRDAEPPTPNVTRISDEPTTDEIVRLLAPISEQEFQKWRLAELDVRLAEKLADKKRKALEKGKDPAKEKLSAKDEVSVAAALPESMLRALEQETGDLRKAGWSRPPGSKWVEYALPSDSFDFAPSRKSRVQHGSLPTVARFAIASSVLPRITDAHSVAGRVHASLTQISDGAPIFRGTDAERKPLEGHRHAHIFCETNEAGKLAFITIYAPMGFDAAACAALSKLRRLWGREGHQLDLLLLTIGAEADFRDANPSAPDRCALFDTAQHWQSLTPFVSTRFGKTTAGGKPKLDELGRQIGGAAHDLARLIDLRSLPAVVISDPLTTIQSGPRSIACLQFGTTRDADSAKTRRHGAAFQLEFAEPVAGPLAFGYGEHFGLGLFSPTTASAL